MKNIHTSPRQPLARLSSASLCTALALTITISPTLYAADDRVQWDGGGGDNEFTNAANWADFDGNTSSGAASDQLPGWRSTGGSSNALVQGGNPVLNLNSDFTPANSFSPLILRFGDANGTGIVLNINAHLNIGSTHIELARHGSSQDTINQSASGTVTASNITVGRSGEAATIGNYNMNGGSITLSGNLDARYGTNFNFGTGGNGQNVSLTANAVVIDNLNNNIFTVGSGSSLTLTGSGSSFADGFALNGGTLQLGNGGDGGAIDTSYALDLANGGKLVVNRSDTVTQGTDFSSAAITGAGTIAHHGTGTLILNANSLSNGQTGIGDLAGSDSATRVLEIRDNSSLGSGQITFWKGGTLDLGADALTVNNFIFNGNYSSGTKTIKLDSDGTGHTGTIAGNMIIQNGTVGSFQMDVGAADTLTLSGTIGNYANGGAGITKIGDGALILSGTNTYKGNTTVEAGTLKLSGGSAIANNRDVVVNESGTLDLNGSSETINRLTGSGTINNSTGNGMLIVGSNNSSFQFDGSLTDSVGALQLRMNGTGEVTLTGASDHNGQTEIFNGTIVASHSSALGTGQVYMGATSGVTQTLAIGADGVDIGNNFFLQNSDSTHVIKMDVDGTNSATLSGNMTNQVDYAGKLDFIVGENDTLTVSGNISSGSAGNSGLDKDGAGTLVLSGDNTYKNKTRINEGTLYLATGYTHSRAGDYELNGGTLKIADGVDISGHAMAIGLGGVISPGNSPGTAITGNQTWNDGGAYLWEINDMAGTKGDDSGWDWLDIQGTLDISATFDILITSLDLSNNSGLADGFDTTGLSYLDAYASFTIATATGGVTGFDASAFNLNDSSFLNPKVGWSIENIGNDIVLNAFFVPEPSSTALLGLGGLALMLRRKRS